MSYTISTEDTIAAICTAITAGQGGVAIIRISGADAKDVAESIVTTSSKTNWESHRVMHGRVLSGDKTKQIDEVLVFFMKSPKSFTGEDVVEIHCHGGLIVVQLILELILTNTKARRALPGEFSQRALLNGKINLTQAESINELISARSQKAAHLAMVGIDGGIQRRVNNLKEKLLDQLSELEARVDFEDELPPLNENKLLDEILEVQKSLIQLVNDANQAAMLNHGINIALIGRPNVGKSSLLNRISKKEKAIVSNQEGTTRDLLESNIILKGLPVNLIDTAGIRPTNNQIEKLGIERSNNAIIGADIVIIIFDLTIGWTNEDEDLLLIIPKNTPILKVGNKVDAINKSHSSSKILESYGKNCDVLFSAHSGEGEDILIEKLLEVCGANEIQNIEFALNERQKDLANLAAQALNNLKEVKKQKLPFDFWTIDLRNAIQILSEITGQEVTENILNKIFSRFCIGK